MLILSADLEWITRMMVKLAENLHVYVLTTDAVYKAVHVTGSNTLCF